MIHTTLIIMIILRELVWYARRELKWIFIGPETISVIPWTMTDPTMPEVFKKKKAYSQNQWLCFS